MIGVSFFGLTWSLLLGGEACSPDGSGGWREGQIFTKPCSWNEGPLKHLQLQLSVTWLTVKWVTLSKEAGMRKQGGSRGYAMWMVSDQADITACWKEHSLEELVGGVRKLKKKPDKNRVIFLNICSVQLTKHQVFLEREFVCPGRNNIASVPLVKDCLSGMLSDNKFVWDSG